MTPMLLMISIAVVILAVAAAHKMKMMNHPTVLLNALIFPSVIMMHHLLTCPQQRLLMSLMYYIKRAKDLISDDGWDFAAIVDSAKTFEDEINLINAISHQPELRWTNKGKQLPWTLNYTVLSFLLNARIT